MLHSSFPSIAGCCWEAGSLGLIACVNLSIPSTTVGGHFRHSSLAGLMLACIDFKSSSILICFSYFDMFFFDARDQNAGQGRYSIHAK